MTTHCILHTLVMICAMHIAHGQFDPFKTPLAYQEPGMEKVTVKNGLIFKTVNDTAFNFDIYYPQEVSRNARLPIIIFTNGGNERMTEWRAYQDWAKLSAKRGLIGIIYSARWGKSLKDTEDLIDYLRNHAAELNIDENRILIWASSGNATTGLPLAMQQHRKHIRGLVLYYGLGRYPEDNIVKRQDIDILVVRAGLDSHSLNSKFESFVQSALEIDAHIELINYPEGQHAFDVFDNTARTHEVITQTLDFMTRTLSAGHVNADNVLTTRNLWHRILDKKDVDTALNELEQAAARYRAISTHSPWFNHLIDERNLNALGYELLKRDRAGEALKVFAANQRTFPDSPNVYDALADAYEKLGDKPNALESARTALEKLKQRTDMPDQLKNAIRQSAEGKIMRLSNQ